MAGERCFGGHCVLPCAPNQLACNGQCISPTTDSINCGSCGHSCQPNEVCSNGMCAPGCLAPLISCNDGASCVDPVVDPLNCGSCGHACAAVPHARPLCLGLGVCTRSACDPGFADCNGGLLDGCEVNLSNDPMNCGGCGVVCATTCAQGLCQ
jgi:hypothetical protein